MASPNKLHLVLPELPDHAPDSHARSHKARRVVLQPDATTEEAYRATLLNCAEHVASNKSAIEAHDPEGVHQARVGLRRVRVAVGAFGEAFKAATPGELSERAKTLASSLGTTRELDVFAASMLPPVEEGAPKVDGLKILRQALEDVRGRAWIGTVAMVRAPGFEEFTRKLRDYGETRAWRDRAGSDRPAAFVEPAVERGADTLDQRLDKARKRAKHLDELDEKERHKLRIALKELRYTAEFYAPLFKQKRVAKFVDRLSELQDGFGDMNDAATVGGVLRHLVEDAPESIDRTQLREAAAFVHGWHRSRVERIWKKARERWDDFDKATPFWRN